MGRRAAEANGPRRLEAGVRAQLTDGVLERAQDGQKLGDAHAQVAVHQIGLGCHNNGESFGGPRRGEREHTMISGWCEQTTLAG